MRILFLGDVVAKSGRKKVEERLPGLIQETKSDFVIVNGENSAHGKGISTKIYHSLKNAGADVVTLGNHAYSKSEIKLHFDECPDLVCPANLEPVDISKMICVKECCGKKIAVVNILGSVFMDCSTDEPIVTMNRLLDKIHADCIVVDLHAEATSEKELFLRMFADPFRSALICFPLLSLYSPLCTLLPEKLCFSPLHLQEGITSLLRKDALEVYDSSCSTTLIPSLSAR